MTYDITSWKFWWAICTVYYSYTMIPIIVPTTMLIRGVMIHGNVLVMQSYAELCIFLGSFSKYLGSSETETEPIPIENTSKYVLDV